jgi:NitT/TauT family transport system ATP-binding protein
MRKDATRARLAKQPLFAGLIAMLGENEGTLEDEEVLADLTIHFSVTPAEPVFATLVDWGRAAELLGYDPTAGRVCLLRWNGMVEPRTAE